MAKTGTIVIDPGHGGQREDGGSSANNATSPSGVLEKNITLRMAFLVREELALIAAAEGHTLNVLLTRESDVNLGLTARARVARTNRADLFLSIHCNASDEHNARGTETLISPLNRGNTNHSADKAFAQLIQNAVFGSIKAQDPNPLPRDRRGVKDQPLGALRRSELGPTPRACMVELEFIDVREVDELLNIGAQAAQVRRNIAKAIAEALISAL